MCLLTMANDGGLRAVLDTSDMVSRQLLALGQGRNKNRHIRQDQEVHELAEKTANALEVNDDSVRSGTKRAASRSLSELSYDFSPKKMNLSVNTSQELMEVVSTLITKMEAIDAAALLSLNPSSEADGARLDSKGEITVPPIHDRITPSYANDGSSNIVRYLHVKEVPNKYSAGIFVFPPNAEIPLHDHPDMVVLSRVLYGEMKVLSYDVVSPRDGATCDSCQEEEVPPPSALNNEGKERQDAVSPKKSVFRSSLKAIKDFIQSSFQDEDSSTHVETDSDGSNRQKRSEGPYVLQANVNQSPIGVEQYQTEGGPLNILTAPHVTCLFPKEGNCHSFVAGPHGAAVLDVLFPPYDGDDGRDCTFFQAKEASSLHAKAEEQSLDKEFTLTPINQPEHFHCLSGVYGRFTTCDEVIEDESESEIVGLDVSVCTSS